MFDTVPEMLVVMITLGALGFALMVGDAPERQGAAVYFVSWVGSMIVVMDRNAANRFDAFLAIDLVVLGAFVLLAWKSGRAWPIWAAAFHAIEIMVDILRDTNLKISEGPLFYALCISSYGVLAALSAGAWVAWREREALKGLTTALKPPRIRL